jgi:two-component system, LuxR family, sensor kinase FixL
MNPFPTDFDTLRRQLEDSQMRASGILETAVTAIITITEHGLIDMANPATERMFGYSQEEMLGQNISMLMPSPYREQHDGYLENYRHTGRRKIIGIGREVTGQRKDGSIFPIDLSVGEVLLPSSRIFTGIIRDLTERKALEEKLLAISEDEQTRIGQDIHDDLCQQLAAISCLTQVVYQRLSGAGSAEAPQLAEIGRLLADANVRAREMSRGLMPVVQDPHALTEALAELAANSARIFGISCRFHDAGPVSIPDNKVATQLFRIGQEALSNAIKHSNATHIEISLFKTEGTVTLSVRDDGCGMPDQDRMQPRKGGLGLLTMTQRARMIGGTLTVLPMASGGTTVSCQISTPATAPLK